MRVALELQPCCGKRSGIGTYTYELARRLKAQDGLEFYGNLFNFWGRNDNASSLEGITMPMRECRAFPYGVYRRIWHGVSIPYGWMFPQGVDLSLFFNYIVPPHIHGKVAAVIYDMTYLRFPETMDVRNLGRIQRDIAYSVERCSQIITISQFSKREIMDLLQVPEERISVVYSAPSPVEGVADFSATAQKYRIREPYILYVGTIEPRKNLLRLLRAFDRLKKEIGIPHQLVLAGGNGWKSQEIYETAERVSKDNDVIFTGYLSGTEKNALYQNAAVFVFPSLYEGFGMPPLEAMAFGCPVVVADSASLPEVVGKAGILVDPLDELSIAEGIWRVLDDRDYRTQLIAKGYAQTKTYTWEASAKQLTDVCKGVLEAP